MEPKVEDWNYTVSEVSLYLRRSEYTIREWCKTGKLPNAKRVGRYWLIPKRDVLSAMQQEESK